MAEVHHFAYGWITPLMAYSLSVLGSLLGLICTARVQRLPGGGRRVSWLLLAAISIGGTGIWVMHFIAMIGFAVVGTDIRYDLPVTALSALVSVVVVGVGLFVVGLGRPSAWKIAVGGVFAGLGVNAMHYLGMASMRLGGDVSYDPLRVAASVGIAVVAATVALWLSVTVRNGAAIFASALVMGVAVSGMHYTGMSAMSVRLDESVALTGATGTTLIPGIALAVVFVVMGLVYSMLAAPTDEDRAGAAFIDSRMSTPEGNVGLGPLVDRPGAPAGQSGSPTRGGSPGAPAAGRSPADAAGAAGSAHEDDVPAGLGASLRETQPVEPPPAAEPGGLIGGVRPLPLPRRAPGASTDERGRVRPV